MTNRNPASLDEARAFVAHVQSLFIPWNIPDRGPGLRQLAWAGQASAMR
jgi:hypothetical protein